MTFIEFTCPLTCNGVHFNDMDCAVEIDVTYRGKPVTYHSPAEGPEFVIREYYVDCGTFNRQFKRRVDDWQVAEADLKARMDAYIHTREGWQDICARVEENYEREIA